MKVVLQVIGVFLFIGSIYVLANMKIFFPEEAEILEKEPESNEARIIRLSYMWTALAIVIICWLLIF